MCQRDGAWFQAAVLTVDSTSDRGTSDRKKGQSSQKKGQASRKKGQAYQKKGKASQQVFTRASRFESFIRGVVGELLSPASSSTSNSASALPSLSVLLLLLLTPVLLSLW